MLNHWKTFILVGSALLTMTMPTGASEPGCDSLKVTIQFDESLLLSQRDSIVADIGRIGSILDDANVYHGFVACSLVAGQGYLSFLDSLRNVEGVLLVEPYYVTDSGHPWLVGESFCLGLNSGVTAAQVDTLNTIFRTVTDRQIMQNVMLIKNTDSTGRRLWELVCGFDTISFVRYAEPNFRSSIEPCAYKTFDYFNELQWQLIKVIGDFDSASVWDFAGMSRPITVAVLDDGVDTHEDLPAERIIQGYDFAHDDSDPRPWRREAHGMACAGLIAASHCYDTLLGLFAPSGITSMDPFVKILNVQMLCYGGGDLDCVADDASNASAIMYAWQQGADILSCSWSYRIDLEYEPDYDRQVVNDALDSAYEFGRNGLGCPLIFSAGNKGVQRRAVSYPARYDKCFAVGAIDHDDVHYPWSGWGPDYYADPDSVVLDIVAPSSGKGIFDPEDSVYGDVWTLDQMDTLGLNAGGDIRDDDVDWDCEKPGSGIDNNMNYNCKAGGTSMAAPLVSGTAALLLSRDSTLTVDMVYEILRKSAVRYLDWGWVWWVPDEQYGYGRVDAFRAVLSISHGNVDNSIDLQVDIGDLVYLVDYMFTEGPPPFPSVLLADMDCSGGVIDIADATYLVDYMFTGGPLPVNPCYEFE